MATLTSLLVNFELNEKNSNFVVTDAIGNDYNVVYGYTLSDVKGLIKITDSQARVIYKNSGWDTDDYSSPDSFGKYCGIPGDVGKNLSGAG